LGATDRAADYTLRFRIITLAVVTKTRVDPVLFAFYSSNCTSRALGAAVVTSNTTVVRNCISHNKMLSIQEKIVFTAKLKSNSHTIYSHRSNSLKSFFG